MNFEKAEAMILARTTFTDDCWEWAGNRAKSGYGRLNLDGVLYYAHRLVLQCLGVAIPDDKQVDHLCRNRACVRPSHLELVDPATNTRRGIVAKLTQEQVTDLCVKRAAGEGVVALGLAFGIHHSEVSRIARHLRYDIDHHRETNAATRRAKSPQRPLFGSPA